MRTVERGEKLVNFIFFLKKSDFIETCYIQSFTPATIPLLLLYSLICHTYIFLHLVPSSCSTQSAQSP